MKKRQVKSPKVHLPRARGFQPRAREVCDFGAGKKLIIWMVGGFLIVVGFFIIFRGFGGEEKVEKVGKSGGSGITGGSEINKNIIIGKRCEGEKYRNWEQGFEVCYPKGWYYQEFGANKEIVGFDKRPIPEATEYGGRIVVVVSKKTKEEVEKEVREELEGVEEKDVEVAGEKGLEISGTIHAGANFFSGQKEINSIVTKTGKAYRIFLRETADNYIYLLPIYNDFIANFKLIEGYPSEAVSVSGNIIVTSPLTGGIVSSPLVVRGRARVWENMVSVQIIDKEGGILAQTNAYANALDVGLLGDFEATLNFYPAVTPGEGTVKVFNYSAKDGNEENVLKIAVGFR